jgi:iron(II)-dependent oxidoreductase
VTASSSSKEAIADRLAGARRRTYELIEPLDDEQLNRVYSPILSPLAWDLGHIANFEELWLVQTIGGREPLRGELGRFYDAIENPRKTRGELPILRDAELRAYLADVRERTLEVLDEVDISAEAEDPLLRDGFVYELLLAHELQHNETMLQLLQMVDGYQLPPTWSGAPAPTSDRGTVAVGAGEYEIGAPDGGFAYDNERPRHVVELDAFEIDRTPVTNGAYVAYMEATGAAPPLYWEGDAEAGWVCVARAAAIRSTSPSRRFTSPGRRPTPTPAGLESGCPPSTSGRPHGPGWRPSAGSGNGPPPISSPTPVSRRSLTASIPRSSSATSTRSCAAAPGRPTPR